MASAAPLRLESGKDSPPSKGAVRVARIDEPIEDRSAGFYAGIQRGNL